MNAFFDVIIEFLIPIIAVAVVGAISVVGAHIAAILKEKFKLENTNIAVQAAVDAAKITVGELEQTIVKELRQHTADGKLSQQEIACINNMLVTKTKEKMSDPAMDILHAANVDLTGLIMGAAESHLNDAKKALK